MADRAREAMMRRGRAGDGEAMYRLAMAYRLGLDGKADPVLAAAWLRAAAKAGHAEAQFLVGLGCHSGEDMERDPRQAVRWFRRAAEQGHVRAQHWLARCALLGDGCEADAAEALCWAEIARAGGFEGGDDLLDGAVYALSRKARPARG
jgi:uncharacterized protein